MDHSGLDLTGSANDLIAKAVSSNASLDKRMHIMDEIVLRGNSIMAQEVKEILKDTEEVRLIVTIV